MPRLTSLLAVAALTFAAPLDGVRAQAVSCEELRSQVEAKIRRNGVADFKVDVVASSQRAEGQVVGTCEQGAKSLIYRRTSAQPLGGTVAQPVSEQKAPVSSKPASPTVITECADGRVITAGSCRQR